jgi:hypothetical protein
LKGDQWESEKNQTGRRKTKVNVEDPSTTLRLKNKHFEAIIHQAGKLLKFITETNISKLRYLSLIG